MLSAFHWHRVKNIYQTGLVFPDPSHMQYGVYSVLRSWWVGRKEELQRRIERWSIVIAKVGAVTFLFELERGISTTAVCGLVSSFSRVRTVENITIEDPDGG